MQFKRPEFFRITATAVIIACIGAAVFESDGSSANPVRLAQSSGVVDTGRQRHTPPLPEPATTAPMPLDWALAKKLPLPEPLKSVQKVIGTPGGAYTPEGDRSGDVWYRWVHDCGDRMSFGDAIVRAGQVVKLWFEGCAGETVVRNANGVFNSVDAHGKMTWHADTKKEKGVVDKLRQADERLLGVPCAGMAVDIEAIADEHWNHPDESRDELVARYIAAALVSLHEVGQHVSYERMTQISSHFVDYVEAHSRLTPDQIKRQFTTDCTNADLPW